MDRLRCSIWRCSPDKSWTSNPTGRRRPSSPAFPWYDQNGEGRLPAELAQFLNEGSPPLVFTLGTAIAEDAGAAGFFASSAAAAKLLGRRAILILNAPRNRPPVLPAGVLAVDYAPFSELFPRAAVIVHHGG